MLPFSTQALVDAGIGLPITGIPSLPRHWIPRVRLDDRLSSAAGHRLTVVSGPPGAGKTVLLAGWARHCALGEVAWLSLETADDESRHFWMHLLGSLRSVAPLVGGDALEALGRQDTAATELVDLLVPDLIEIGPTVLVMDDFHVISDPEILATVAYLVSRLPGHVRIILGGRHALGLPSHRLRVSGQLAELGDSDLRFTFEEAAALLFAATGRTMAGDDVEVLLGRTEGWAAGLRIAALELADEDRPSDFVRRFGGDDHLVAEYFQREVLDGAPADLAQFLLQTSVLDEMTGTACGEITGRADSARTLECLAGANLFVIRLDSTDRVHRYHRLFAGFLRHRLVSAQPPLAHQAHLRAAHWLLGHGDRYAAAQQFVRADACEEAMALGVADLVGRLTGGLPGAGVVVLPGELPESYFEQDPFRMYVLASALLCALRPADAARWLRRLALVLAPDDTDKVGLLARAELLWAIHDALVGDGRGVVRHHERARRLVAVPDPEHLSMPGASTVDRPWLDAIDAAICAELPMAVAHAHLWLGQTDQSRAVLDGQPIDENCEASVSCLVARAIVAREDGRLRDAKALACHALDVAAGQGNAGAFGTLGARLALAGVFRERDKLEAAEEQLGQAVSITQQAGPTRWASIVECERVELMMARGRHSDALEELRHLRDRQLTDGLPDGLASRVDRIEVRCRLALGDHDGATLTVKSMAPDLRTDELLAGLDLCGGRPDRAVARLTATAEGPGALRRDIERPLLLARAYLQLGDQRRADVALRTAVDRGRPEGYVRVFLDDAPELPFLLHRIAGPFPDAFVAELISHADHAAGRDVTDPCARSLEPLTDRERELLSYLPSHLSQHEIARAMYVSINTVKTHIRGIYRKLGAESRSQAVDLARVHGLV